MQRNDYKLLSYTQLCQIATDLETAYKAEKQSTHVHNAQRDAFFKTLQILKESMQVDQIIPAFVEKAAKIMTGFLVAEMEIIEHDYNTFYRAFWGANHSTAYRLLSEKIKLDRKQHRGLRLAYLAELFDYLQELNQAQHPVTVDRENTNALLKLIQDGVDCCVKRQKKEIDKAVTADPTPFALFSHAKQMPAQYQSEVESRSFLRRYLTNQDGKEQMQFVEFIQKACLSIYPNEVAKLSEVKTYDEAKKMKSYCMLQATMIYLALLVKTDIPGKSQGYRHKQFLRAIHKSDMSQISYDERIDMLTDLLQFVHTLKKEQPLLQSAILNFPTWQTYLDRTEKNIYQLLAEQHAKKANPYGFVGRVAYEGTLAAVKYGVGIAIFTGMEIALAAAAPVVITAASAALGAPMVFLIKKGMEMLVSTPIVDSGLKQIMLLMVGKISSIAGEKATATGYVVVKPTIEGAIGLAKTYMEAAPDDQVSPREWRDALLKLPNLTEEEKQMLRDAIPEPTSSMQAVI